MDCIRYVLAAVAIFVACDASPCLARSRKDKQESGVSVRKASSSTTNRTSSAQNRRKLAATVVGEIGLIEFPQFGYGVRAAFLLSPRLQVETGLAHSAFKFIGFENTSNLAWTRAKWFAGNSFYLTGGLGVRMFEATRPRYDFKADTGFETSTAASYERTSLTGDLAIGNQWQFSSFTIGCDWAGIMAPLATLSESSSQNPSSKSEETSALADDTTSEEEEARQDEEEMKAYASAARPQFVRFYLGWSF
jgi:hypothetical protein